MQLHEIAHKLNSDPVAVCNALGFQGKKESSIYKVDIHSGKAIITLKGNKQGVVLFTGGKDPNNPGSDMLTLAMEVKGGKNNGIQWAKSYLGISDDYKPDPERESQLKRQSEERRKIQEAETEKERERKLQSVKWNWEHGVPIKNTPAEKYLMNRGIPKMEWPDVLRYNPECYHATTRTKAPALMCLVTDCQDKVLGLKNIFVTPEGNKATITPQKPTMGNVAGGSVKLFPQVGKIGLCEGVETALGAYHLSGCEMPVWAALSTAGITGFKPPWVIEEIILYPDGDLPKYEYENRLVGAGELACLKAQENQTIETYMMPVPKIGTDYLDIWNARN